MASPQASPAESIAAKWQDLDDKAVYDRMKNEAGLLHRKNFVVQLGPQGAQVAFDLTEDEFSVLLNQSDRTQYPIRWINIWIPGQQPKVIETIGTHYRFSRRLQALFTLHDAPAKPRGTTTTHRFRKSSDNDPEKGYKEHSTVSSRPENAAEQSRKDDALIYNAVKEKINYFSVDQDPNFLCIGAHWLHQRSNISGPPSETERLRRAIALHHYAGRDNIDDFLLPQHWSWLALCHDNTALSIHEAPEVWKQEVALKPQRDQSSTKLDERQKQEIANSRQNTLNALLQFSIHGVKDFGKSIISQKEIRQGLSSTAVDGSEETQLTFNCDEVTSNMFYYLFEDYIAIGPILEKSAEKLATLTDRVLNSASRKSKDKDDLVRDLHSFGKDLRQLKHLFKSYRNIVKKVRSTPKNNSDTLQVASEGGDRSSSGTLLSNTSRGKITLTESALNRFERLDDRLQLLLLNTIDEYLDDIAALNQTYFNLTQQKDSEATARLTRSATLLAKLSVLFLPISFMTSYFSVEIPGMVEFYTPTTYWYSFAVILTLSFAGLFFFSRVLMFFIDRLDDWGTAGHKRFAAIVVFCAQKIRSLFAWLFARPFRGKDPDPKNEDDK